jgi:hypothetical protein
MRLLPTLNPLLALQHKRLKDLKLFPVPAEKSLDVCVAENLADVFMVCFVVAFVLAGLYARPY